MNCKIGLSYQINLINAFTTGFNDSFELSVQVTASIKIQHFICLAKCKEKLQTSNLTVSRGLLKPSTNPAQSSEIAILNTVYQVHLTLLVPLISNRNA